MFHHSSKSLPQYTVSEGEENVGIGLHLFRNNLGNVIVKDTKAGGAAEQAGILPGAVILSVDDMAVFNLELKDVRKMIMGPVGSTLRLLIKSPDQDHAERVTVRRYKDMPRLNPSLSPKAAPPIHSESAQSRVREWLQSSQSAGDHESNIDNAAVVDGINGSRPQGGNVEDAPEGSDPAEILSDDFQMDQSMPFSCTQPFQAHPSQDEIDQLKQSLIYEVRKNNDNVVHYINGQLEATLRKMTDAMAVMEETQKIVQDETLRQRELETKVRILAKKISMLESNREISSLSPREQEL
mmetsp:Transcript_46648/g.146252  ORF Transcript_46648/g.146252 Transcript_46648/m.146252 type:complete len:296 (-) Transcript_46648:68-955(-)